MCKYCKRLEEVRKNDKREYFKLIAFWKRRYYKAYSLLRRLNDLVAFDECDDVHRLCRDVYRFLESEVSDDA